MSDPIPPRPGDFFDSAYRETPPWDIGAPQPDLLALLDEYPPTGTVLDVGCGTGDLSLELARRGLAVLGVDLARAAIAQAAAKAEAAAPEVQRLVQFRVADALHPAAIPGPFNTVVDTGFFHIFGPAERDQFAHELAATLPTGGRYYLLGFAIPVTYPNGPRPVHDQELRARFAPGHGWRILVLRPAQFMVRRAAQAVPAVAMCVERVPLD